MIAGSSDRNRFLFNFLVPHAWDHLELSEMLQVSKIKQFSIVTHPPHSPQHTKIALEIKSPGKSPWSEQGK